MNALKTSVILSFLFAFLVTPHCVFSQIMSEKSVALAPITYDDETATKKNAEKLYNYILDALQKTQRFKVLDRFYGNKLITQEKNLQQGADFVDGKVVAQGKQIGADYMVFVYVNSAYAVEVQREVNKQTERVGYECILSLFVRVINVENGQIVASDIISPNGKKSATELAYDKSKPALTRAISNISLMTTYPKTPDGAIEQAMSKTAPYIRQFIDEYFPFEMRISDIQTVLEGKKNKERVFLEGGNLAGLQRSDNLIVIEMQKRKIGDKIYTDDVPIGKLRVERVNTDGLIVCEFVEKEDLIKEKWNKDKKALKVRLAQRSGKLFGN